MNNSLWSDALYRLSRNRAAMFGGFILILLIICAALALDCSLFLFISKPKFGC